MPNWEANDDADACSISLSVEISVELPLMEECVAQTVVSLRQIADRIEQGEDSGRILDKDGNEIGSYDCLPEEIHDG